MQAPGTNIYSGQIARLFRLMLPGLQHLYLERFFVWFRVQMSVFRCCFMPRF